jgi:hypothetical protein
MIIARGRPSAPTQLSRRIRWALRSSSPTLPLFSFTIDNRYRVFLNAITPKQMNHAADTSRTKSGAPSTGKLKTVLNDLFVGLQI